MHVIGRTDGGGPTADLGRYLARDGSTGGHVALDLDRPHAGLVVGKRGTGKSYTLGVLAEEVADTSGLAPVVLDPMGAFSGLVERGGTIHRRPRVRADTIAPAAWLDLLDLDPAGAVGALVWRAFAETGTLEGAMSWLRDVDADPGVSRAGLNHLSLADSWNVFSPDGLIATDLDMEEPTVLDCSALPTAATNAVCRALASGVYRAAVGGELDRLPWLFLDEAHVCFDGVAAPALRTVLTRGRSPGVSLICATQRPSALPSVARSQADLLVAHRLTTRSDLDALVDVNPALLADDVADRLVLDVGQAVVVDDATKSAHSVRIGARQTSHDGGSPRASNATADGHSISPRERTETGE